MDYFLTDANTLDPVRLDDGLRPTAAAAVPDAGPEDAAVTSVAHRRYAGEVAGSENACFILRGCGLTWATRPIHSTCSTSRSTADATVPSNSWPATGVSARRRLQRLRRPVPAGSCARPRCASSRWLATPRRDASSTRLRHQRRVAVAPGSGLLPTALRSGRRRQGFSLMQRLQMRQDLSLPILEQFRGWIDQQRRPGAAQKPDGGGDGLCLIISQRRALYRGGLSVDRQQRGRTPR